MSQPRIECFLCGCYDNLREVNDVYACKDARGCLDRQKAIDDGAVTMADLHKSRAPDPTDYEAVSREVLADPIARRAFIKNEIERKQERTPLLTDDSGKQAALTLDQLQDHLAARKMWNYASARALILRIEDALAPHFHVALGGSVLLWGASDKDLDLFIYPHRTPVAFDLAGRIGINKALRNTGLTLVAAALQVQAEWRKKGSKDEKFVEVWRTEDGKRVDVFYVR